MTSVTRLLCLFNAFCVFAIYVLATPREVVAGVGVLGWLVAASFAGRGS